MIVRIKGKKIVTTWSVDDHKEFKKDGTFIFTDRPQLKSDSKVDSWGDICSFEGDKIPHNSLDNLFGAWGCHYAINISEDESVRVEKEIFRADLNEIHAFTDKVISESTEDKASSEKEYDNVMREFNKTMIEADDKLMSYCKLHRLDPKDTDCIELFKLVYDTSDFAIAGGKIKQIKVEIASSCYDYALSVTNGSNITAQLNSIADATISITDCISSNLCTVSNSNF